MSLRPLRVAGPLGAAALLLPGCLGEPPIEERWTLLEIVGEPSLAPVVPGQAAPISLTARVTYREILTGAVIAEIRASTMLGPGDTGLENDSDPLGAARDVDEILRNSVSLGFATRAVTGFDHLVQEIPLTIETAGMTPEVPEGAVADTLAGPARGLFLLLYFGEVEEEENEEGDEIEVVTPFFSDEWDILSTGQELGAGS
jgi:hypothetical protein